VNAVIFRQNTRALFRRRVDEPAGGVRKGFETHKKWGRSRICAGRRGVSLRVITARPAAICKAAFEYAKKFGYKSVTICEKPNVLRETSGLFTQAGKAVGRTIRHRLL